MKRHERLEEYLFDHDKDGSDFSAVEYADAVDIDGADASADIQAYLVAQRGVRADTLYVLYRKPGTRTTSARWMVGTKAADARRIGKALTDDTKHRVMEAFAPDLHRIAKLNPQAARRTAAQISGVMDGVLKVLEAAAQGIGE